MNKILLAITIIFTTLIVMLFIYFNFFFLELNENEILKASNGAFRKQTYNQEVLNKIKSIEDFSKFLVSNSDSLIYFNQSNLSKTWEISKGSYYEFMKKGECFVFITTNDEFIEYYVPCYLLDNFKYYIKVLNPEIISSFELCTKKGSNPSNNIIGTLVFRINCNSENPLESNFYLQHSVSYNLKDEPEILQINNIMETLQKDTVIAENLRYLIRVLPYAGI